MSVAAATEELPLDGAVVTVTVEAGETAVPVVTTAVPAEAVTGIAAVSTVTAVVLICRHGRNRVERRRHRVELLGVLDRVAPGVAGRLRQRHRRHVDRLGTGIDRRLDLLGLVVGDPAVDDARAVVVAG